VPPAAAGGRERGTLVKVHVRKVAALEAAIQAKRQEPQRCR